MARIKPFKGIRPPKDLIEQVASRPYDVLNSEEAREEAKGNEKSLYHIIKPEIDFPVGTDEHDPAVYLKAAANFRMFQEKGWLVQDKEECYYVYAQTMNGKTQYGLVVGAYVPDYMNGVIKKHELTRRDKEEDRMKHVRVNNANIEPVFFAYPDNAELDQIVAKYASRNPEYDFVAKDDGFGHTFWIIDEPADIARITELFGEMPSLYIADGHHRYETALNFRNYCREQGLAKEGDPADYIMMMLVDMEHDGLVVFPTHRLLRNLKNFDPRAAMKACEPYFRVEEKACAAQMEKALDEKYAKGEKAFGFYCGGDRWTLLTLKDLSVLDGLLPGLSEASKSLDVTVLHTLVLEKLFGIDKENMANQVNLTYTRSFQEAVESVEKGESQCAFILNPTRVAEIRDVAAAGEKMPQKSTYFYPKLITGLVMNPLK